MENKTTSSTNTPKVQEGPITQRVEDVSAQISSATFVSLALASVGVSAAIAAFSQRKTLANFVGLWAPTLLLLGVYTKLVQVERENETSMAFH